MSSETNADRTGFNSLGWVCAEKFKFKQIKSALITRISNPMLIQSWGLHLKWENTCHVMLYYLNEWDTKTKIQVALFAFNFRLDEALGRG